MKRQHKIILFHIVFWLGYMLISTLIEFVASPKDYFFSIGDFFFTQFPNICTFYLSILLFRKYINPLKIYPLIIGVVVIYLFTFSNWYLTAYLIRPLIKANGGPTPAFQLWAFAVPVLWLDIKYSFFAFGYYYASENIRYQKQLRGIEEEKHQAQYAFLRSQINPHFLNNTLNFFYAKSIPLSEELSEGIMILSEIMRYSLEIDKDDKTTLINREIEHIRNVIRINQLRFNNKLQIEFTVNGPTDNVRIIPLILITIVENILKHGNCTDVANPAKVILNIGIDGSICLNTFNTKKKTPKELSSGIGMDNIKKRLLHFYEKGFSLDIHDTEVGYTIKLKIEQPASAGRFENNIYTKNHPIINRNENLTPPYPIL
jgi:two-component system LytT family sensor kinase